MPRAVEDLTGMEFGNGMVKVISVLITEIPDTPSGYANASAEKYLLNMRST